MSGGGALTVIGVAVTAAFASKGAGLQDQLNGAGGVYPQLVAGGCGAVTAEDAMGADSASCETLRGRRDELKADGKQANNVAFGMLAVSAVGVGLLIGGVVAYVQGKRATDTWESSQRARVRVVPSFTGLSLQGRF
jgi:hypothetical protein